MPTYEYRCERGHTFEVVQRMTEDALSTCEVCDAPAQRVLYPVAVHFKGKGFYNTDYGTRKRNRESKAETAAGPAESKPEAKSSESKASDSKPAAGAKSSPD